MASPHPEGGCCSRLLFLWVGGLLSKGFNRALLLEDLWQLRPSDEAGVTHARFAALWSRSASPGRGPKARLAWTIWRMETFALCGSLVLYTCYIVSVRPST